MARRRTTGTRRHVPRGRRHAGDITASVVAAWLLLLVAIVIAGFGLVSAARGISGYFAPKAEQVAAPSETVPAEKPAAKKAAPKKAAPKKPALPPLQPFPPTPGQPVDKGDGIKIGTFLGNSTRRFYGIGPVPEQLRVIWKAEIGSGKTSGTASSKGAVTWAGTGWTGQPTLVRDKGKLYLLIGGFDHGLRKIDAATGKTVWRYEFPDVIKGTNTVWIDENAPTADGRIRVVCGSRRGTDANLYSSLEAVTPVRCVSFETGKEIWRLPVPHTESYSRDADGSALYHKGRLYQPLESGNLYGIDPNFTSPLGEHRQPLVVSQALLYGKADVSAHRGNVVLEGSPCVIGQTLYIEAGSGHVYGLSLPELKTVWDFKTGSDMDSTAVATRDGFLLCGIEKQYIKGKGGVIKLDPRKLPEQAAVWYLPTGDRHFVDWDGGVIGSVAVNDESDPDKTRPPLAAASGIDGNLYLFSQNQTKGTALSFDGATQLPTPVIVAKRNIGGSISTPLIVEDHVIAAGYDAKVHVYRIVYDAKDGSGVPLKTRDGRTVKVSLVETDSIALGASIESTPIVWNGRIYIGCRDGKLYCLGK